MQKRTKRWFTGLALSAVVGILILGVASAPRPKPLHDLPQNYQANLENGKNLYNAGGCYACHKADVTVAGRDARLPSGGGFALKTPVGTLYAPNLTPDAETGLGRWTDLNFVNAMQRGISPSGMHYIPAFPYTSYAAMSVSDILDIKAYLMTLPAVSAPRKPSPLPVEPVLRRSLGLWQWLGLSTKPWHPDKTQSVEWNRGSYLVNGPGHCAECHTPRTRLMTMDKAQAFMGGPHPGGEGKVPSLHGLIKRNRYKDEADLVLAFQNGEEFGYTHMSSGGMGEVQGNIAKLPEADVKAIANYLVSLP